MIKKILNLLKLLFLSIFLVVIGLNIYDLESYKDSISKEIAAMKNSDIALGNKLLLSTKDEIKTITQLLNTYSQNNRELVIKNSNELANIKTAIVGIQNSIDEIDSRYGKNEIDQLIKDRAILISRIMQNKKIIQDIIQQVKNSDQNAQTDEILISNLEALLKSYPPEAIGGN